MTRYESRPTYREVDGEIMPSYTGVNQPRYPRKEDRDTELPHDYYGSGPLDGSRPEPTMETPNEGYSVPLNRRDFHLLQAMDSWAEANKLEGLAKGMHTPVHRQRLGADDNLAANSADKARRLRSEARDSFESATGVHEMSETDGVDPDVLIVSMFQNFKETVLADRNSLNKRRKLHRRNLQNRQSR